MITNIALQHSQHNYKPLIRNTQNNVNKNIAFQGDKGIDAFAREATLILQSLTPEVKQRISTEFFKGFFGEKKVLLLGKLANFFKDISEKIAKTEEKNGHHRALTDFIDKEAHDCLNSLILPEVITNLAKKKKEGLLKLANPLRRLENGQVKLNESLRKQIVDLLENSKTYEDLKNGIKAFTPTDIRS
ncbi:MAG: hypothetical protein A2Y25_05165 [Candidatus Melainabacteria bacterium GWF2_37_15]|nr:MAG: hypothetical protein A2Y25_05165 [Candidatus Melainabacteria bacterium GWF2_37_15]